MRSDRARGLAKQNVIAVAGDLAELLSAACWRSLAEQPSKKGANLLLHYSFRLAENVSAEKAREDAVGCLV